MLKSPLQPQHSHLESYPGGVRGADQSLDQVLLRLGLHLGQRTALGDTELECGQPVGGTREELETLGGGHRPAGGAGGGGDALEGVGGPAGDGGAGEEREETAGQSALGGASISVSQSVSPARPQVILTGESFAGIFTVFARQRTTQTPALTLRAPLPPTEHKTQLSPLAEK